MLRSVCVVIVHSSYSVHISTDQWPMEYQWSTMYERVGFLCLRILQINLCKCQEYSTLNLESTVSSTVSSNYVGRAFGIKQRDTGAFKRKVPSLVHQLSRHSFWTALVTMPAIRLWALGIPGCSREFVLVLVGYHLSFRFIVYTLGTINNQ